jgi:hypothetical protein
MICNWGLRPTPECDCGSTIQAIEYIKKKKSPNKLFGEDMNNLHMATPEAIEWISNLNIKI